MDLVSVIIPSFNRFPFLLNAIQSIKAQTYPNLEIIVVNDASTEKEYYAHEWPGVNIIHLPKNSKQLFGFACPAHVRNQGLERATGKYVAFCDDDDVWFPSKLELQLNAMKQTGCKMSATDGFIGKGVYENKKYKKYNAEHYFQILTTIYKNTPFLDNGFPRIWTKEFLQVHNCVITSSVVLEKDVLDQINNMRCLNGREDYDCWLRALDHTTCVYLQDICFYYDCGHGNGSFF